MPRAVVGHSANPRTPTSATSAASILMSSPSVATSELFHQIKQETEVEYQLLSPISSSSGTKIIRVTPSSNFNRSSNNMSVSNKTDHEYFSATPITPSSGMATPSSKVYLTPTGGSNSPAILMPMKVEARRRLNLDAGSNVDRDGFKTPIKGTKRKHDFSSPSPKKRKSYLKTRHSVQIHDFCTYQSDFM